MTHVRRSSDFPTAQPRAETTRRGGRTYFASGGGALLETTPLVTRARVPALALLRFCSTRRSGASRHGRSSAVRPRPG